jgi:hypothetical protein
MKHSSLQVDERSAAIFGKVCTRMYLATIGLLWLDVLYRQLWLGQPVKAFWDIAVLLIFNVVLAIAAILYFGGVTLPKIRASLIVAFYAIAVVIGTGFWLLKDPSAGWVKFLTVASISAVIILLYLLAAYRGIRAVDKKLED